jgi:hypothetical protein
MRFLSKSKLLAYRQCPKRLWLEVHRPELCEYPAGTQAVFRVGREVGEVAHQLYDPKKQGTLVERKDEDLETALQRSADLLNSAKPIFEAGFAAGGAMAFTDIMLPLREQGRVFWRIVEVKASTSVKDYQRDDIAVQAFVANAAGVALASIAIAHIDSDWVYPGAEQYAGLLKEEDLTKEALGRENEVKSWINEAHEVVAKREEPEITTGRQCSDPYDCGFLDYCRSKEKQAEYPVAWLPSVQARVLKSLIEDEGVRDMRDVPDDLLNERQLRVKTCTLADKPYLDAKGAKASLAPHPPPAYFLDFETNNFAVPIWKGTRPYQQIPFQFSVHRMSREGSLAHKPFLDLSGEDPSKKLAEALIDACADAGPVFVYNAAFERGRINELADCFPRLRPSLLAINERIFDLLKVVQQYYYHPIQHGSFSIKSVLPAIAPELSYEALEGVQDGGMAMDAYLEAIHPETIQARKDQIREQLLAYCCLDTLAMVRLWEFFVGRALSDGGCR